MNENPDSINQKSESSPSLESSSREKTQLPAKVEINPLAVEARAKEIGRKKGGELEGLNAARAALNLPPTNTSAAISAFNDELQRLEALRFRSPAATSSGEMSERHKADLEARQAKHEQGLDELLQQVLGERVSPDSQSDKARLDSVEPASEPIKLSDFTRTSQDSVGPEQQRIEGSRSVESQQSLAHEGVRTAREQAQEMLESMKKTREIVGERPREEYAKWAIQRGMSFSDTVKRLENFLNVPESNNAIGISPTIRQYFLELGPEETIQRAKDASPELLQRVAQNVREGNLKEVVYDMESLDSNYLKAFEEAKDRERAKYDFRTLDGNGTIDRALVALTMNNHQIVTRLKKMNGIEK